MIRKPYRIWLPWAAALLVLSLGAAAPRAQEGSDEAAEEDTRGQIFVEIASWVAKPNGLGFQPATRVDPASPFGTEVLGFDYRTKNELRYRAGYSFGAPGSIVATWYGHSTEYLRSEATPGTFGFGEIQAHPLFAGFANDGLADGFTAEADASLRDLRLDFYRPLARSARLHADWFAGLRRVQFNRGMRVSYPALVPELPPLGAPLCGVDGVACPDLRPPDDTALTGSKFTGRGVDAGIDVVLPFWDGKIRFEAGFAVAALLADLDAEYASTTSFYTYELPTTQEVVILDPTDYNDAFGGYTLGPGGIIVPNFTDVTTQTYQIGLMRENVSGTSFVIDGYLGVRSAVWRSLEIFLGYRNSYYSDIALELKPVVVTTATSITLDQDDLTVQGINVQNVQESTRSATFEGIFAGIAYRF